jgi:hypothetical protein
MPATVTVPSGSTSNTFVITAANVLTATPVQITATYGTSSQSQYLTVNPWISSFSLSPTTVVGGNNVTGTIMLNAPAPTGGLPVTVSANNGAVTVSGSTTVPAGNTSETVTLNTAAVSTNTSVQVTASYSSLSLNANLTVTPLLASLSLSPSSVAGGTPSTGTVYLNGSAPSGGAVVTLSSNSSSAAVPAPVTVAAGTSSQTFSITTSAVTTVTSASIGASNGGATVSQTLTVNPISVSLGISPSSVIGGASSTGTITLSGQAPVGGLVVTLSSSNTACATVPASITVPAGSTSAQFSISTLSVTNNTSSSIGAAYGGRTSYATITVLPLLSGLTVSPTSLVGGAAAVGTVTLNGPAPAGGSTITLTSSAPSAAAAPSSVVVAAGATQQTFNITTSTVTTYTNAIITASNAGKSAQASLTVLPMLESLTLNPYSIYGGGTSTGTVTLYAAAPAGGITIPLTSGNTAVATVPASVTVTSGNTTGTFTITTSAVTTNSTSLIGASYAGATSSQTLTVVPLLSSVSLNPTTILGGASSTATVTLSGPAPAGGISIALTSSATAVATVPATLTIAAGSTSGTFSVTGMAVTSSSGSTITAAYGGVNRTAVQTVVPLLSSLTLSPSAIVGGDSAIATVNFSQMTTSAVTLVLGSTSLSATVPATLVVASGKYNATFPVTSTAVSTVTTSAISAAYAGVTKSSTLTVDPMPTVLGVSTNPSSLYGGRSSTGVVTLSGIAPAAGALVVLTGSNPAAATVPASVTVSSGQTTGSFTIPTTPVAANTTATVTGTYNSSNANAVISINRPILTSFTFAQSSTSGGSTDIATLQLSSAAPTGGVTFNLVCTVVGASGTGASWATPVVVPAGSTSLQLPVQMSTVNAATTLQFTATNSVSGGESLNATVSLTDGTLHAVDIMMPQGIVLNWGVSAVGNLLLYRGGTLVATLPNTATQYTDAFVWVSGQTYTYTICDGNASPPALLSTEQCVPVLAPATQDQAIDSRLDTRYATVVYVDHLFGSSAYRGGLFVGFNSDPARVGRSFAEFTLGAPPALGVYRTGKVNAYLVAGDTDNGAVSETVGCQTIPNNSWAASTITWDTPPTSLSYSPTAATQTITTGYDPATPCALVPTGASGQVGLTWIAPTTAKTIASYTVSYGTSPGYYPYSVSGITATSATITGLTNGTMYYFVVAAHYSDGSSSNSSQVASLTPPNTTGANTAPSVWYSWPLSSDIYSIVQSGGGPYSVAWASMNESQLSWVYFAKNEYDGVHGPAVTELWSLPTLLSLLVPTSVSSAGGSATGTLSVNAIGLQGSAAVQLTSSNPAVAAVPSSITVSGLNRTFTITLAKQTVPTGVTITATLGGVTLAQGMTVTP